MNTMDEIFTTMVGSEIELYKKECNQLDFLHKLREAKITYMDVAKCLSLDVIDVIDNYYQVDKIFTDEQIKKLKELMK